MASSRRQYPFHLIEPKWQQTWEAQSAFRAFNPGEKVPATHPFAQRHGTDAMAAGGKTPPKYYILDMFPYPSGAGLHVGHPEGYTATDILARYRRACGFNVLHPMGWDSFGLPAEQYAVKTGQHPRVTTEANIANFTRQIKSLGFSYDWSRELATTDPDYFKWTQWIFLKLYNSWFNLETNKAEPIESLKFPIDCTTEEQRRAFRDSKRLAFVSEAPVNWCPELGTVLANEEVIDGKSEVGGFPVIRKPMRQWMLRITAYAEKLLADLDIIDWSDSLKEMQRNWIGRSEGAEVIFQVADSDKEIRVFTTRPDTLFGATYMVLAPEHQFLNELMKSGQWPKNTLPIWKGVDQSWANTQTHHGFKPEEIFELPPLAAVETYRAWVAGKSDLERTELAKEKTGVFTGLFAVNPVDNRRIPIFMADYVLATYGTGAIMAVPAHDERDMAFAEKFGLEVRAVIKPDAKWLKKNFAPSKLVLQSMPANNPAANPYWSLSSAEILEKMIGQTSEFCNECLMMEEELAAGADFSPEKISELRACYELAPQCWRTESSAVVFSDELSGTAFNSANGGISLNNLPTIEAKKKITAWLEEKGLGKKTINFKLRDWLFSRQRYWGEPFPIIWKKDAAGNLYHEALPESTLPLLPPPLEDYKPTSDGQPPLARAKDWCSLPDGSARETNTMPQWAGSCWYYLRYTDAKNPESFVGNAADKYWMASNGKAAGVDLYVGGTEHAVLHLLYARFWHKVLFDLGHVLTPEPFYKLVNQGLILGEVEYFGFKDPDHPTKHWVSIEDVTDISTVGNTVTGILKKTNKQVIADPVPVDWVEPSGGRFVLKELKDVVVDARSYKMSKSRGNVVNPDDVLKDYGADAFRLYEMFMGPLEMVKPWNTKGVEGVYRFLGRIWRLFVDESSTTEFEQADTMAGDDDYRQHLLKLIQPNSAIKNVPGTLAQLKILHACIKKVTEDLDAMRFNTAISAMMVFVNESITWEVKPLAALKTFLQLLQPFAPHLAEELWAKLPHAEIISLAYTPWPKFDPALLVETEIEMPVQVNGKFRDVIKVAAHADNATIEAVALASEKVQQFIAGKPIKKIIIVPKRMVNIAVAG